MFPPIPPAPEPEAAPPAQDTDHAEAVYNRANFLLRTGTPPHEVEQALIAEGLDAHSAALVVRDLRGPSGQRSRRGRKGGGQNGSAARQLRLQDAAVRDALRASGQKNMLIGGLVCAAGLLITLLSFAAASGGGGGSYVIAWGAVVFGAIQFFRGASQAAEAKR